MGESTDYGDPQPRPGRHVLAPRDPSDPATLPTLAKPTESFARAPPPPTRAAAEGPPVRLWAKKTVFALLPIKMLGTTVVPPGQVPGPHPAHAGPSPRAHTPYHYYSRFHTHNNNNNTHTHTHTCSAVTHHGARSYVDRITGLQRAGAPAFYNAMTQAAAGAEQRHTSRTGQAGGPVQFRLAQVQRGLALASPQAHHGSRPQALGWARPKPLAVPATERPGNAGRHGGSA